MRAMRLLAAPSAPIVFGATTALVIWWVWGSLRALPWLHDEKAFLLQAELFARGRWSAPSPPIPEFFEQFGVLVTPALASKMFPGHSLMLVPGVWLGLPALVPVLMSGVTGALIFALARRVTNPWVALLTWLVWLTAPWNLRWRTTYLSETTTSAAWLAAWWSMMRWRDRGNPAWVALIAGLVAFGAITRPLTMVAFATLLGVLLAREVAVRRAWRAIILPTAVGVAILALVPLWSLRVTGDWRMTPLALYTRQYIPFDVPGLGYVSTPPLRPLPPDLQAAVEWSKAAHRDHTLRALPRVLAERVTSITTTVFDSWRRWLPLFLPIGLVALPRAGLFALATVAAFLLSHLAYAHGAEWTVYYLEAYPVLGFVAAVGIWRTLAAIAGDDGRAALAALGLASIAVAGCMRDVRDVRSAVESQLHDDGVRQVLFERIPGPAIVFVRYAPTHPEHASIVVNQADPVHARLWLAYDRGRENERLMQLAPERRAYLFNEATGSLTELRR